MRIKNIIMTGLISSAGILTMNSCKKAPFRAMPAKNIAPVVTERVDSIVQTGQSILKDKNYKKFGVDTLELTEEFFNNPAEFVKNLNKHADYDIPKTCTGSYTTMLPVCTGKSVTVVPQVHYIYKPNFVNPQTVISSKEIFTRNGNDLFIPVEYYGLPNPKLKNKSAN